MSTFFLFLFIKIPMIFIGVLAVLYLVYIKNTYEIVDSKVLRCTKNNNGKYDITYEYYAIYNNVIEQTEKSTTSFFKQSPNSNRKLLIHKKNQKVAKLFYETIFKSITIIILAVLALFL